MRQYLFFSIVSLAALSSQAMGDQTLPPAAHRPPSERIKPECRPLIAPIKLKFDNSQGPKKAENAAATALYARKKDSVQFHLKQLATFAALFKEKGQKILSDFEASKEKAKDKEAFEKAVDGLMTSLKGSVESKGTETVYTSDKSRSVTFHNGAPVRRVSLDGMQIKISEAAYIVTDASEKAFKDCEGTKLQDAPKDIPFSLFTWRCQDLHHAKDYDVETSLDLTSLAIPKVEDVIGQDPSKKAFEDFLSANLKPECFAADAPVSVAVPAKPMASSADKPATASPAADTDSIGSVLDLGSLPARF